MYIKNSVLPQANIYTSKIIFDKLEDRNQKRIAQMIKRKNILLTKNKRNNKIKKDKSSEQMITPSTQEISSIINNNTINNNILDLSKSSIKEEENHYNKILSTSKPITMKRFLSSFKFHNKNSTDINEFNIIDEDLSEKEINISNLNDNDNDTFFDNYKDEEKNEYKNNNKNIFNNKKNNKNNKNNINIYNDNDTKEKNNICQRNKYAIEFLSSNLYSFVEFKNKLVTKAKYNKHYFTSSYSQALFLDNNIFDNKMHGKEKTYNYEVNDIIKEENEPYSPKQNNKLYLRQSTNLISIKKKTFKDSIKLTNNKVPNKTLCKTVENCNNNKKNLIKDYNFNKNALINNCKLKITKTKLSMEIRNKRKIDENKESKKVFNINDNDNDNDKDKSIDISPKLLKFKSFLEDIHNKKENNKKSYKEKSKKIKKKVKINIK